jgi:hypothetical protein
MFTQDELIEKVARFYIDSSDFNGIPVNILVQEVPKDLLIETLVELIESEKITLIFGKYEVNPHIKRFPDISVDKQIEILKSDGFDNACAYPSGIVIRRYIDVDEYDDRPFTKRLLLSEPQLQPVYFDLAVLERYFSDPRYRFSFSDYTGSIGISDDYYLSEKMRDKDKFFIQTFGLGYAQTPDRLRVAVVYLRYLHDLSPEHQRHFQTYLYSTECKMCEGYYRNTIGGQWATHSSIYHAFLEEQIVINRICELMGRPHLFRNIFNDNRPREFSVFLRPTRKNHSAFIHLLDKMLADNINHDFFQDEIPAREEIPRSDGTIESRQRGTLTMFHDWLKFTISVPDESVFLDIIEPLKKVRKLRQKPAHSIMEDEYNIKYYQLQDDLMEEVYTAIRYIRLLFANHPKAKDCEIPDWLYEGRIVNY